MTKHSNAFGVISILHTYLSSNWDNHWEEDIVMVYIGNFRVYTR